MAKKTYAQARQEILDYLKSVDWDVSLPTLKVPYATSPDKTIRLWFKPQAVYFTQADTGAHHFSNARTVAYDFDYRSMSPADFLETVTAGIEGRKPSRPSIRPSTTKASNPSKSTASGSIVAERKALRAQIREKRRTVLPALKNLIKQAEKARRARIKQCRVDCRQAERKAKQTAKQARRKLEQHIYRLKNCAVQVCESCKTVDEKGLNTLQQALENLETEKRAIADLRRKVSLLQSTKGKAGGRRSAELRSESDSEVLHNLSDNAELIALFKKVRGKIKATPHMTRTEAFFDWLHNHPEALDELRAKQQHQFESEAKRMYAKREAPPCLEQLKQCERELDELKAAERFLEEAEDVPF